MRTVAGSHPPPGEPDGERYFHEYDVRGRDDPGWREYREYVEFVDEAHRGEWLWVEEKMTVSTPSSCSALP